MPLSSELSLGVSRRLSGAGEPALEIEAVAPILRIQARWSELPGIDHLVVEFTESKEGQHLFVFPMAGRLVHEGLSALMAFRISKGSFEAIQTTVNDYGFSLTASSGLSLDGQLIRDLLSEGSVWKSFSTRAFSF